MACKPRTQHGAQPMWNKTSATTRVVPWAQFSRGSSSHQITFVPLVQTLFPSTVWPGKMSGGPQDFRSHNDYTLRFTICAPHAVPRTFEEGPKMVTPQTLARKKIKTEIIGSAAAGGTVTFCSPQTKFSSLKSRDILNSKLDEIFLENDFPGKDDRVV
ncbi:hypothetical protein AVEN_142958-1 [Araneus ventricosus]|uniref:Uncharacterized protein n=1 Tax=Araneus ventricosus TaxID=182803 RepID=A0A4Y2M7C1_ARAVE|nr:hypothetical protein AVEN_142958-1 [Araneus ventricosus]